MFAEVELIDEGGEAVGFVGKAARGRGGLLDHGCVLLGHLVHVVDDGVDLADRAGLLLRPMRNLLDHPGGVGDLGR